MRLILAHGTYLDREAGEGLVDIVTKSFALTYYIEEELDADTELRITSGIMEIFPSAGDIHLVDITDTTTVIRFVNNIVMTGSLN